jgi:serine/threonine-protein kinase ATR
MLESVQIENEPSESTTAQYKALFKSMATGLRAGSPQLKIVTCATTSDNPTTTKYDKPIQSLAGMEKLFDIIAMHTYALKSEWPSWEASYPEDPNLKYLTKIEKMIKYKKSNPALANKPIWITEFGYDAGTLQAQTRHPLWKSVTDPEQALWIVRSFLVFSAMEIDRAYLYWFEDDDAGNLHGASGIVRKIPNTNTRRPKPSFYAMRHLFNALGSFRLNRVISKQEGGLYTYEYIDDANHLAWVVWSGTKGKADSSYTLSNLPGKQVIMQTLTLNDAPVASTTLQAPDNRLTLMIGETPKFLFFQQAGGQ